MDSFSFWKTSSKTNSILSQAGPGDILKQLISILDSATLCPGNIDARYIEVCKRRKNEKICGERDFGEPVGYLDIVNSQDIAPIAKETASMHNHYFILQK